LGEIQKKGGEKWARSSKGAILAVEGLGRDTGKEGFPTCLSKTVKSIGRGEEAFYLFWVDCI